MVQTIRSIAREEAATSWHPALAVVTSVHGRSGAEEAYACTVQLRESGVVLPRVPVATGLIGLVALPDIGDLVLVVFAGGDLHAPVVMGRLYDENVAPPEHGPGQVVAWLPHAEEATDKRVDLTVTTPGDGTRSVHLVLDGSVKVELEVTDEGLRLQAQDVLLHLTQSSSSDGRAELSVAGASVVIEQGNVTVTAEKKLLLKGNTVEISGDTSVKVAGQTIDLN